MIELLQPLAPVNILPPFVDQCACLPADCLKFDKAVGRSTQKKTEHHSSTYIPAADERPLTSQAGCTAVTHRGKSGVGPHHGIFGFRGLKSMAQT